MLITPQGLQEQGNMAPRSRSIAPLTSLNVQYGTAQNHKVTQRRRTTITYPTSGYVHIIILEKWHRYAACGLLKID